MDLFDFAGFMLATIVLIDAWIRKWQSDSRADEHRCQQMLWRKAALDTAAEWVRREKGEVASKDFREWALHRAETPMLRDHLPAIAWKHAAKWPNNPNGAA